MSLRWRRCTPFMKFKVAWWPGLSPKICVSVHMTALPSLQNPLQGPPCLVSMAQQGPGCEAPVHLQSCPSFCAEMPPGPFINVAHRTLSGHGGWPHPLSHLLPQQEVTRPSLGQAPEDLDPQHRELTYCQAMSHTTAKPRPESSSLRVSGPFHHCMGLPCSAHSTARMWTWLLPWPAHAS